MSVFGQPAHARVYLGSENCTIKHDFSLGAGAGLGKVRKGTGSSKINTCVDLMELEIVIDVTAAAALVKHTRRAANIKATFKHYKRLESINKC